MTEVKIDIEKEQNQSLLIILISFFRLILGHYSASLLKYYNTTKSENRLNIISINTWHSKIHFSHKFMRLIILYLRIIFIINAGKIDVFVNYSYDDLKQLLENDCVAFGFFIRKIAFKYISNAIFDNKIHNAYSSKKGAISRAFYLNAAIY